MGPTALFDKSFLQNLSVDESVWFSHFFIPNVCPVFFVEVLTDLAKETKKRTAEEEVELIAARFPDSSGSPNALHSNICIAELMGHRVSMTGQIPISGGTIRQIDGKAGAIFQHTPEAKAFSRWQDGKYFDAEREFAKLWRTQLHALDLTSIANSFREIGIDGKSCKTLADAKSIADQVVNGTDKPHDRIGLALSFLGIPGQLQYEIVRRWNLSGCPPLETYAPYSAHVVAVEIFFHVAIAANLISPNRASNRTDISYLFYLPFCMVFISSDKLHQRCAPLFLRGDQEFVWGQSLKEDLRQTNLYFDQFPVDTKEKGIMAFAHHPPDCASGLIRLWDCYLPNWRKHYSNAVVTEAKKNEKLVASLRRIESGEEVNPRTTSMGTIDLNSVSMTRMVRKRKGSWYQLPKDFEH